MKLPVFLAHFLERDPRYLLDDTLIPHGFVEVNEFNPDKIADQFSVGRHGLIVVSPEGNYYLKTDSGWKVGGKKSIMRYLWRNRYNPGAWI